MSEITKVGPVYQLEMGSGTWRDITAEEHAAYIKGGARVTRILHTHPADQSELVKAAEEVVKEFSPLLWGADGPAQTAIRNLRDALDKVKS